MRTKKETDNFLKQFEIAKKNVAKWPKWMRDAAYVAAATFPTRCECNDKKKKR